MAEQLLLNCVRCGKGTEIQPNNPFSPTHPLWRLCKPCLRYVLWHYRRGVHIDDLVEKCDLYRMKSGVRQ